MQWSPNSCTALCPSVCSSSCSCGAGPHPVPMPCTRTRRTASRRRHSQAASPGTAPCRGARAPVTWPATAAATTKAGPDCSQGRAGRAGQRPGQAARRPAVLTRRSANAAQPPYQLVQVRLCLQIAPQHFAAGNVPACPQLAAAASRSDPAEGQSLALAINACRSLRRCRRQLALRRAVLLCGMRQGTPNSTQVFAAPCAAPHLSRKDR